MIPVFRYFLRFILLAALQVLVFNNILLFDLLHPYVYIFFILLLPVFMPHWLVLMLSFLLGLIVDLFLHTPGIHAGASVLLAFLRRPVFRMFKQPDDLEPGEEPHIPTLDLGQFLLYNGILTLVHHTFLYLVEAFRFGLFGQSLLNALVNTGITLLLLLILELLFYYRPRTAHE